MWARVRGRSRSIRIQTEKGGVDGGRWAAQLYDEEAVLRGMHSVSETRDEPIAWWWSSKLLWARDWATMCCCGGGLVVDTWRYLAEQRGGTDAVTWAPSTLMQ